jgi:hypothetical protein
MLHQDTRRKGRKGTTTLLSVYWRTGIRDSIIIMEVPVGPLEPHFVEGRYEDFQERFVTIAGRSCTQLTYREELLSCLFGSPHHASMYIDNRDSYSLIRHGPKLPKFAQQPWRIMLNRFWKETLSSISALFIPGAKRRLSCDTE